MSPETPLYDPPPAGAIAAAPPPRLPSSAADGPYQVEPLNLARRPFLNSRPVVRLSLLLTALGIALLIGNLSLFRSYRDRSADKRAQIDHGSAEIARQQALQAQLQKKLDSFDLDVQNQKIDFLNQQIRDRTFSWSTLLDRIAERLPNDIRLNRLAPLTGEKADRELQRSHATARRGNAADQVTLAITGETRDDGALLTFVDRLFKPPFAEPDLTREERSEDGKLEKFEISVQYRPGPPSPAAAVAGGKPAGVAPRIEELPPPAAAAAPVLHPAKSAGGVRP
jgi:hypothetical protein